MKRISTELTIKVELISPGIFANNLPISANLTLGRFSMISSRIYEINCGSTFGSLSAGRLFGSAAAL